MAKKTGIKSSKSLIRKSKVAAVAAGVCAELLKASGEAAPAPGEEYAAFAQRLCVAVGDESRVPTEKFNELSAAAQEWYDKAGDAINGGRLDAIPPLDGYPAMAAPEGVVEAAVVEPEAGGDEGTSTQQGAEQMTKAKSSKKEGKATKAGNSGGRKSRFAPTATIKVVVDENPKRVGTDSYKRFALYTKHHTVESFLKAGGRGADLSWDTAHKFVTIK